MVLRHQLAVYSPITARAVVRSGSAMLGVARDARRQVLELLRREYSASSGLLCGSGTQALQVAITIARNIEGDDTPVALPAFSCFDVAAAAVGAKAPIALYDIDPNTLGPDIDSLERVLAGGARVCVIAPLYGMAVDWGAVEDVAARHGARLIEDGTQGHGAMLHGRPIGSLADLSTLSFGRGKGWTGGGGGAVLFRGGLEERQIRLAEARIRGEASTVVGLAAQWTLGRPHIYGIPRSIPALGLGETTYRPPCAPTAMTRAAAAALMATRSASTIEAQRRRTSAREFLDGLSEIKTLCAIEPIADSDPGYLRLPVRLRDVSRRPALPARLHELGVEGSYPMVLGELPVVRELLTGPEREWCGAAQLVRELITLPTHSHVTASDRNEVVDALTAFAAHEADVRAGAR